MRIYYYGFPGHYLGGNAVVIANGEDEARELVEQTMRDAGLDPSDEEPDLIDVYVPVRTPKIIHFNDGNY